MSCKLRFQSAADTHPGNVRAINEDAYYSGEENNIWAIADGMGGHYAGDVASRLIIESLAKLPLARSLDEGIEQIVTSLKEVNRRLQEDITIKPGNHVIGSTVVVAFLFESECACLWAGDSRLYVYRGDKVYQVSHDHSVVQEMVDNGIISAEEAITHPQSNVITRAVGTETDLKVDVNVFDLEPGDRLLLCSDGLYGELPASEIKAALDHETPEVCVTALIEQTIAGRAKDNVTVSVIDVYEEMSIEDEF
ncbi:serine/threonine-protein phosphatase [Endozoicomonas sp. SM1973]|uniref:Serine/threonine-protein phosphatase n=1 Tax=Spartinivicinus marinus TaxID=2994442 RepID=A0A853IMQ0_9GAMM|nr:protein phosphatase 2C domain-containing protein [Spartinivicinus marinus]MCX4027685.1 protein phosphatase 2C domain-containing protein [Spartinivicinus marinus]NYZ69066.1 serine/threonine-protein phosphatase [Spartinivicinus marinus]